MNIILLALIVIGGINLILASLLIYILSGPNLKKIKISPIHKIRVMKKAEPKTLDELRIEALEHKKPIFKRMLK